MLYGLLEKVKEDDFLLGPRGIYIPTTSFNLIANTLARNLSFLVYNNPKLLCFYLPLSFPQRRANIADSTISIPYIPSNVSIYIFKARLLGGNGEEKMEFG